MSKMENTPGEMGFLGVDTTTAPLLLASGALTKADEVVIRRNTQLESRVGFDVLTMKSARPFNTTAADSGNDEHYPMFPVNAFIPSYDEPEVGVNRSIKCFVVNGKDESTRYWGIAEQFEDAATTIPAFAYPDADSPYMKSTSLTPVDPTTWNPEVLGFRDTNYWGQNNFILPTLRFDSKDYLMTKVEPRIVGDIYATDKGPARLEEWVSTITDDGVATDTINMGSRPLAIPQVPYVEPRLIPTVWDEEDPLANSIYASQLTYCTFAYAALAFNKTNFGAPSPLSNSRTPLLPAITTGSVSGDELTITVPKFGLQWTTGDDEVNIVFKASTIPEWVGTVFYVSDTITEVGSDLLIPLKSKGTDVVTGEVWATDAVTDWAIPFKVEVDLYQPKETRFATDNILKAGFPIQTNWTADQKHNYKLYRTKPAITTIDVGPIDPGSELFECTRLTWGATDPDYGRITILDNTTNAQLGTFLYTNPSQQGSNGANTPPPLATIAEVYKGYYFWAGIRERMPAIFNIEEPESCNVEMEELDYDTWNFNAENTENLALLEFQDSESTGPYFLQYINRSTQETAARSLVRIINGDHTIPYNAFYLGGFAGIGAVGLLPICYRSNSYRLTSSTLDQLSFASGVDDNGYANYDVETPGYRIRYSKYQIPHGTPDVNYVDIDTKPTIIALRSTSDRLNIITDNGIWELTGQSESSFDLRPRDTSAKCLMPGAVQVLNDNLFVMTTQGLRVYGSGTNISRPLDSKLFPLLTTITDVSAWAQNGSDDIVSSAIDDINNEYMLFLRDVTEENDTNVMLRFSLMTDTWTVSSRDYSMGYFHPDYKRMIFGTRDGHTIIERNAQSILVGSDEIYPVVFTEGGNIVSVAQNAQGLWDIIGELILVSQWGEETPGGVQLSDRQQVEVGDWLYWEVFDGSTLIDSNKTEILKVTDIDPEENNLQVYTVAVEIPLPTGSTKMWLVKPLKSEARFAPMKGENPTTIKKWSEMQIQSNGPRTSSVKVTTSTNEQRIERSHVVANLTFSFGWNTYGWGTRPWADPTNNAHPALRTFVPQPHGTSRTLTVELANVGFNEKLNIQAVSVVTDQKSTRVAR